MVNVKAEINIDLNLAKFRNRLRGVEIAVYHEDELHPTNGKLSMTDLAEILHEGAVVGNGAVIPPRRYLVDAVNLHREEIRRKLKPVVTDYVMRGIDNFQSVADSIVEIIKTHVRSGYYRDLVPNAPSTIKKKGSDIPLVDTDVFLDSLVGEARVMSKSETEREGR